MDAIRRSDSDSSMIGKSIILPFLHTGGPRYRAQNYQDAMAICRWAGYPDLFLTFTCNPKWPEINEMLHLIGQHDDDNRVDIICRVFQIKLFQLMQDLKKQQPFGKIIASEIPDMEVDPDGYNPVNNYMMYVPCGALNPQCPCMKQGKCSKHFSKKFNNQTTFDADGFPIDRKRNIELCNYSRSVKYLFKYINKGSDRATATIECTNTAEVHDEIKRYLDCRYISATEACWRIFIFDILHREPAVERFPFYLEGENTIVFEEEERPENIIRRPASVKTKFTEWFTANQKNDDARELTYSEFPTHWVWDENGKNGNRRKMGKTVAKEISSERFTANSKTTRSIYITCKDGKKFERYRWNATSRFRFRGNRLINEELDYDKENLQKAHDKSFTLLNDCQKSVYGAIMASISNEEGRLFFIMGHGGTGKTFLWNAIISKLRSQSKIVLPIATSVIAALLLPNGRTAHSRFHIPLDISAESTCEIKQNKEVS
ncbi:uncharacterized protein LOC124890732 [Capsicum annuum]|uniref:uncharacterized protein LOC124890732 n=1 Tax=Capsicum annuum TaxID=4072 RepID=UPI001FB07077|nr:uncharacterized protein LOC124890732 [Capsicum annuum]